MTPPPRVSVIVLSHRFDLAVEAMRSVKAQSYPADRIDLRLEHALDYYPDKFNHAWAGCRGTYFVFLPDDDTLDPEFVTRTVTAAERANADLVITDHYVTGRLKLQWRLPVFDAEVLRLYACPWMTFLVRADFWRNLPNGTRGEPGGWDGAQAYSDWDAGIRMYQAGANTVQLSGEFLWNRSEHRNAGSWLMDRDTHAAALAQLRRKHSAMAHA
jgi:hypothetical protein